MKAPPTLPLETDVLIVGAGPTGLALAISLQQAGIRHLLIDKLNEGLNTSRAAVIHVHTLEVLDQLGVGEALAASGMRLSKFRLRDRDRVLLRIGFDKLPSRHPYLLMLPQDQTERILGERLASLGGAVYRGVTATGVEQDEAGATVTLDGAMGSRKVRTRFVVGGDGMQSIVRQAAGIAFEGSTYEDSFVLADVRLDWPLGAEEVSLFLSAAGLVVVAPLPGDRYRIVASMEDAPERPGIEHIQALLDARGPRRSQARVRKVVWSSRFRIHHRLARSYRSGRLLLMGDAAHVHSPAGGQGMNAGLVDAVVLGRLLAAAIRSGEESVLDRYEEMRRPAAESVLRLAGRLTSLATVRGRIGQMVRNTMLWLLDRVPAARRKLTMDLSGLSRRALAYFLEEGQDGEISGAPQLQAIRGGRA
ncbi:MAG: FAD-dependent monooxygenase [Bryobacterales bacterium]|nr:FAD-dependent monooxygenase [Bryobacterales bacterium]